jgi:uroporphyrinogen decarboxylase
MISRSDLMRNALECKDNNGFVPVWELHFQLWNKYSNGKFLSGNEYLKLPAYKRLDAIRQNADIMVEFADKLSFSAVTIPDAPWDCVYVLPQEDRLELVRQLKERKGDFLIVASSGAYLGMPDNSDDYVEFCYTMMDEPEKMDELARRRYIKGIKDLDEMIDAGIDVVYSGADQADNRGPFYNPEQRERWIWNYQNKWAQYARKHNVYPIMHTDGNVMSLLDRIANNGVAGLQGIDPVAGMDIDAVFNQVEGRICICGNIDCGLMYSGTPQQVYEATKALLMSQRYRKGFVLGSSNAVIPETPIENYEAFLSAWRDFTPKEVI